MAEPPYEELKARVAELEKQDKKLAPVWDASTAPPLFLMTDSLQTGGSERQFALLARALQKGAFHLRLGCIQRKGSFLEGLGEIQQFNLGGSFLSWHAQHTCAALTRFLRHDRIAVAQSFDFYSNLLLIPVARLAGVPVILGSQRQLGDLLRPMQRRVQNLVFRWADCVVCNSQAAAHRLATDGVPRTKLSVIRNSLAEEAFTFAAPALPFERGVSRVGMIARMNDRAKNHGLFLRAAARIADRFPLAQFVLVGDGPFRKEWEELAQQLGIGPRVRFLGDRRDIPSVLASLDVVVNPSRSESLSNAILEAMAAGRPVVATRVGGNPELVRDHETGLLIPPGDEAALTRAVENLLAAPRLAREWGENARRIARDGYTMERAREQFEQLYLNLLARKGWRPTATSPAPRPPVARRLRVAVVAPSLRYTGGQSVQADLLLRNWRKDPEVEAYLIPVDPDFPSWLRWTERVRFLRTLVRTPLYLASVYRNSKDADLLHIFSASYWSFLLAPAPAWWIGRMRGRGTLINYHSGEAEDHLRRWRSAVPLLRRADAVVVPSHYLARVFAEHGLKIRLIPNVVDPEQFRFRRRESLRPLLLNTRTLEAYYSVDLVVRAFARVQQQVTEARLCLVGGGSREPEVRALANELGLAAVDFTGPVTHSEISRYYDQWDIFVNSSWLDNMPVSILEAFAVGMPVVTTAPEGIRYLVEHQRTGLLCDPGDWQALAENVVRLLREPELARQLAENAYEESRRYRWEATRGQWVDVYRAISRPQAGAGTAFASSVQRKWSGDDPVLR